MSKTVSLDNEETKGNEDMHLKLKLGIMFAIVLSSFWNNGV